MQRQPYFDGPPQFNVGLRRIELESWLLPDDQSAWLGPKNDLINRQPHDVFVETDGSRPAQHEAADLISAACDLPLRADEAPLLAAARLVSDDLVIMERQAGDWTNTACCLCSPTFFSAHHATGKSLLALHDPVPDGGFGLASRIGRVFGNLAQSNILERHNWTVQWSDARYTPDGNPLWDEARSTGTGLSSDHLFLRVERQTIRRLPQTGAILFTIRIRLTPLVQLFANADHAAAFRFAWQSAPLPVRTYKNWAVLERHVAALLAEY